jgi:hypothetical protein
MEHYNLTKKTAPHHDCLIKLTILVLLVSVFLLKLLYRTGFGFTFLGLGVTLATTVRLEWTSSEGSTLGVVFM